MEDVKKLAVAIGKLKQIAMGVRNCAVEAIQNDEIAITMGLSLLDDPTEFEEWVKDKGKLPAPPTPINQELKRKLDEMEESYEKRLKKRLDALDARLLERRKKRKDEENERLKLVQTVESLIEKELQTLYKMERVISKKTIGSVVVLATRVKEGDQVALKFMVDKSKALREITILECLEGKCHTIKLLDHFYSQSAGLHCLVLPYYGGKGLTSEDDIRIYMTQLLQALEYCHKKKIIHRDVNPNNVLFKKTDCLDVVLADFDTSAFQIDDLSWRVGTLPYMSPEMLFGRNNPDFRVDIWSAGVVFVELLLKKSLFRPKDMEEMINIVTAFLSDNTFWKEHSFPRDVEHVLKCMLVEEKNRKTASQLLKMKYFKKSK